MNCIDMKMDGKRYALEACVWQDGQVQHSLRCKGLVHGGLHGYEGRELLDTRINDFLMSLLGGCVTARLIRLVRPVEHLQTFHSFQDQAFHSYASKDQMYSVAPAKRGHLPRLICGRNAAFCRCDSRYTPRSIECKDLSCRRVVRLATRLSMVLNELFAACPQTLRGIMVTSAIPGTRVSLTVKEATQESMISMMHLQSLSRLSRFSYRRVLWEGVLVAKLLRRCY